MGRVKGAIAFKRLLLKLPQVVRQELIVQLNVTGRDVLSKAQGQVPIRTGALRSGLSMRVYPASLKLKVGIIGKPLNRKLFYGRIIEFGRKGQSVRAQRANSRPYVMRVRGMAPRRFLYNTSREEISRPFRDIWELALKKAAVGETDE